METNKVYKDIITADRLVRQACTMVRNALVVISESDKGNELSDMLGQAVLKLDNVVCTDFSKCVSRIKKENRIPGYQFSIFDLPCYKDKM